MSRASCARTRRACSPLRRLRDLGFPYDDASNDDWPRQADAFAALCTSAGSSAQPGLQYIGTNGTATLLASESYPALDALYVNDRSAFNDAYDAVGRAPRAICARSRRWCTA